MIQKINNWILNFLKYPKYIINQINIFNLSLFIYLLIIKLFFFNYWMRININNLIKK